jgi:S1-C subfamily serine protease
MTKIIIALTGIVLLLSPPGNAQHSLLDQILQDQPAIVSIESDITGWYQTPRQGAAIDPQTGRMVVLRNVARASYHRSGAGVIIHPLGIIVTNAHNVKNANKIVVVFSNSTRVAARLVTLVDNNDLALLQIKPPFPLQVISIADSDKIALGEEIITIGNSPMLKQTVSGGKVTGLGTSHTLRQQGQNRTDLIRTSLNLYHGDSGGPLFDRKGQLIGLLTASETSTDHSSFAIPSNQIRIHLNNYLKTLKPQTP